MSILHAEWVIKYRGDQIPRIAGGTPYRTRKLYWRSLTYEAAVAEDHGIIEMKSA